MKACALLVFVFGCSLLSRSEPVTDRYFAPELTSASVHVEKAAAALRLGRVTASESLRAKIVHRDSSTELGKYETLRWADDPDVYVRESLRRALFDQGGLRETDDDLPSLDVDVLAFEEVRRGKQRSGRVQLRWRLHDEHGFADGLVTSEVPATSDDIDAIVRAISTALGDVTSQVKNEVRARLH